jgi:hypothetical protein
MDFMCSTTRVAVAAVVVHRSELEPSDQVRYSRNP